MSTVMTERRRPLENDDGQGALFGGEAFAPSGPAPAWNRPARQDAPSAPRVRDATPRRSRRASTRRRGATGRRSVAPSAGESDAGVGRRPWSTPRPRSSAPRAFESAPALPAHGTGVERRRLPSPTRSPSWNARPTFARRAAGTPGRADARRRHVARVGGSGHGAARGLPGVPRRGRGGAGRAAARALLFVRDDDRIASGGP